MLFVTDVFPKADLTIAVSPTAPACNAAIPLKIHLWAIDGVTTTDAVSAWATITAIRFARFGVIVTPTLIFFATDLMNDGVIVTVTVTALLMLRLIVVVTVEPTETILLTVL